MNINIINFYNKPEARDEEWLDGDNIFQLELNYKNKNYLGLIYNMDECGFDMEKKLEAIWNKDIENLIINFINNNIEINKFYNK